MNFLDKLFRKKVLKNDQAVFVYLDGQSLPDEMYEEHDLLTLEDELGGVLEERLLGELDGNEIGPEEAVLFMYGPDAEAMFSGIEATLRAYPLCRNARVVIRQGPSGAPEREIRLPRD
jgi:hypothetical protein